MRKTLLMIATAIFIAACGGGGATTQQDIRTTTTGQELLDLKKARDAGAISQEEYDKQRAEILKRSN